jgi:hypothetical protein
MADALGMKIHRVLNIDDKVEQYLFFTSLNLTTDCQKNFANQLIQLFAEMAESDNATDEMEEINGEYALWVTFELK